MKQRPRKVLLNEELADWSAVYLAMWKALESFDPSADRRSEPVSFGSRQERIRAAENAISRVKQRHGNPLTTEKEQDIRDFHGYLQRLIDGASFGAKEADFTRQVRQIGSSLADQSVVAVQVAEP